MKNKSKHKDITEEVGRQVFGEPIEPVEEVDEEIIQSEDAIISINSDEDFSKEAISGYDKSLDESENLTNTSPSLTSDDIDADWQEPTTSEETSMADNPTPDQDQIDSVSKPWGTDYPNDEELDVKRKARMLEQEREDDENKQEE